MLPHKYQHRLDEILSDWSYLSLLLHDTFFIDSAIAGHLLSVIAQLTTSKPTNIEKGKTKSHLKTTSISICPARMPLVVANQYNLLACIVG